MVEPRTLALDAMGGDHGPEVVIPGAAISLVRHPQLSFIFFGDEARMAPILDQHPALKARSRIVHTALTVSMNDKPSQALRRGKGSSMCPATHGRHRETGDRGTVADHQI
jgi:glycerol-3-phosphate acyltransferase PlsX